MNCPHGYESINCPQCALVELRVRLHDSQAELAAARKQITALQEYNNREVERRRLAEKRASNMESAARRHADNAHALSDCVTERDRIIKRLENQCAAPKPDYAPAVREVGRLARKLGYTQVALKFATEGLERIVENGVGCGASAASMARSSAGSFGRITAKAVGAIRAVRTGRRRKRGRGSSHEG